MIAGDAIRITPPAALPVSLAELKAHLRVTDDHEDPYLAGLIRVATEEVEEFTGLALITSTWRQTFSAWPTVRQPLLSLRRRPLQSVVSIDYRTDVGSPVGAMALLDPSAYVITGIGYDKTPGAVRLGYLGSWPPLYGDSDAIQITYTAGFGDDHNAVPESIRHAVMLIAGTRYAFREDAVMGSSISELPSSSQALLRPWRPLAVA